jgi:polyisoprenoid-binding protein YceI
MFVFLLVLACTSEIDNKQAAEVKDVVVAPTKEVKKSSEDTKKKVSGDALSLSSTSTLEWVGAKVTGDHKGGFTVVQGSAKVEGDTLISLDAEIDISSMFSDSDRLTTHLLSKDFFESKKYPKATFSSTKIENGTISGVLDMRMIKKEISFPAKISVSQQVVDIQSEFTINRRLWEINYDGKANNLIKDNVLIKLNVQYK